MGAWGCYSDENDNTADALGLSIEQRVNGVKLSTKEIEAASREFSTNVISLADEESLPGVVRWGLLNGLRIALKTLRRTAGLLRKELATFKDGGNERGWKDPKERVRAIKSELKAINYALENGGYGRKGKTHGIATALRRVIEEQAKRVPPGSAAIHLGRHGLGPWPLSASRKKRSR